MMILSQNQQTIASTDNVNYIQVEEKEPNYKSFEYEIIAYYDYNKMKLGKYKTAERANEILQDMYNQLMTQNFSFTYKMPKE